MSNSIHSVLYVDDDQFSRALLEYFFSDSHLEVATAEDEETFKTELSKKIPDVVLMDAQLEHTTGLELSVKLLEQHPSIPVVFLTSNCMEVVFHGPKPSNVKGLINKPFAPDTLIERIEDFVFGKTGYGIDNPELQSKIQQLQQKYLAHLGKKITPYQDALKKLKDLNEKDFAVLSKDVHKIAGTSGLHGFEQISQTARDLEDSLMAYATSRDYEELESKYLTFIKALINTTSGAGELH